MVEDFVRLTGDLVYRPKAVFPSEMFLFYTCARLFDVRHIVESGVGYGGSTSYLRALFPYMPITCVDDGRYGQLKKIAEELVVKIVLGDARALLPQIVAECTASRIAVLIDGPKGKPAVKLAKALLLIPAVKVVAVHDLAFDAGKAHRIDSQDDNFRRAFGFLDDKVGAALTKHPRGPGLSIFHA